MQTKLVVRALKVTAMGLGAGAFWCFGSYCGQIAQVKAMQKRIDGNVDLASKTLWDVIMTAKNGALTHKEFEEEINNVFAFLNVVSHDIPEKEN